MPCACRSPTLKPHIERPARVGGRSPPSSFSRGSTPLVPRVNARDAAGAGARHRRGAPAREAQDGFAGGVWWKRNGLVLHACTADARGGEDAMAREGERCSRLTVHCSRCRCSRGGGSRGKRRDLAMLLGRKADQTGLSAFRPALSPQLQPLAAARGKRTAMSDVDSKRCSCSRAGEPPAGSLPARTIAFLSACLATSLTAARAGERSIHDEPSVARFMPAAR
jgi:hypothetical protein